MPRNVNGIYILPEDLFAINTVIESSLVNNDLSDIASALTDTINTDGTVPMTGTFRMVNSENIDAITFSSSNIALGKLNNELNTYGFMRTSDSAVISVFKPSLDVDWSNIHSWAADVIFAGQIDTTTGVEITTSATYQGREITSFNAGTVTLFMDATVPTGWVLLDINEVTLRIVDGTGGILNTGDAFSTIFNQFNSSFTAPDNNAHTHTTMANSPAVTPQAFFPAGIQNSSVVSSSSGGSSNHNHIVDTRIFFVDMLLGVKA